MNDTEELAYLRARVAELEGDLPADAGHQGGFARSFTAAALIVVACLLAPLSVVSVWADTFVSDTNRYVETVSPVIDDPGVQTAIADEVTVAVMDSLDVQGLTADLMGTLADQPNVPPRVADALPALAVPLARGIEDFTRTQAEGFVASSRFQTVWDQVNRAAHAQVVDLLEGNPSGALTAQNDQIVLNLAPVIAEVKARLVDRGFTLANKIPAIDRSFVLVESAGITRAQTSYSVLNALGVWLPLIALALLVAGVAVARDRRRALLRGTLGVAAAMLVLGVGLTLVRVLYVQTTPADVLTSESAGNVFDILVRFLRTGLRTVGVLALVVAFAAWVSGPSSAARRTRGVLDRGVGSARSGADAAGWRLSPVENFVTAHRRGLQVTAFLLGGLTLMFWNQPTVWVVLLVALVVAVLLAVIAFFTRPVAVVAPVAGVPLAASVPTQPGPERQVSTEPRSDVDAASPQQGDASRTPAP